jgi:RNA polymerase sigma-70 factor (ECF subfamily)
VNNNKTSQIAELANQYGRQVFQTAYRLLGDKHLAEDIVQDVFLKLFKKKLEAFDQIQSWPAYLKVMTTSASYDLLRKKTRQAEQSLEVNSEQQVETNGQDTLYKQLMLSKDMGCFRKALCQIPQLEANVFSLRHIEEFSYQEIAEQLSITTSNVGITLNRAKQKLSQILKESQFLGASYETK